MDEQTNIPILLVTANVGSIFEDPSIMLEIWTQEFLSTISRLEPKFIALHCQEVGGKNYEESMQHVDFFVKLLMDSDELRLFDKVRIYLDEDYSLAETFTALGNFYFIHQSVTDVLTWDFKELCFVAVEGKEIRSGDIEDVPTKEKSKFPQDFFPECKWSRKGFMRTRWNLNGTVFDLINIHLFHDASNFVAMETFPSVYSKTRQRALEYTLERFHNDQHGTAPFFLFGDFNFRTDTRGVINRLCEGLNEVKTEQENGCSNKVEYRDAESRAILTLGKKEFCHLEHQAVFLDQTWLREYDRELEGFCGQLFEYPIEFPPSYPFVEDSKVSSDYMKTRCPAWCDRVVLSETARPLVLTEGLLEYGLIGRDSCMGDHKPVYLKTAMKCGAEKLPAITALKQHLPQKQQLQQSAVVPLTERYLVKRVNSASIVEVKVGLVRSAAGSCKGSGTWRSRSVSVSSPQHYIRTASRVRLISNRDLQGSVHRLQSHHSSSDEEWFEEEPVNSVKDNLTTKQEQSQNKPPVEQNIVVGEKERIKKRKVKRRLGNGSNDKCCSLI
ncbi:inositol polyphosphate-5-phosphatase A isoform X6 [Rhodnius prolixus]|uniref:inositol polyphosphate-5-phosphatase A isoform X6 n=1 Tax=Rhodnius prolixus TaxID=13249 RepID=UPI003D18DB76